MTDATAGRTDPPRSARVVLAVGVVSGLVGAAVLLARSPEQLALASDVYFHAGEAVLAGEDVYDATPPDRPAYRYLYPPAVALGFVPHALLGSERAAFALQTALNLAAGVGTAGVCYRALRRRGVAVTRADLLLLVAFVFASAYGTVPLVNGQVTHWVALGFAVGFEAIDRNRGRLAGAAFGAAALLKVFPAAVGLWLLRVRARRAVVAAVATGVGGLLVGLVALGPELTASYFADVLVARYESETFGGRPDPTGTRDGLQRQLAALGVGPALLAPVGLAVLAGPLAAVYRRVDDDRSRLVAALATVVGVLLFLPLQPLYFLLVCYPLVVLLYAVPPGGPRRLLVAGTLCTFLNVGYEHVALVVGAAPLPESAAAAALSAAETGFVFARPPAVGMWLLLAGCVLLSVER